MQAQGKGKFNNWSLKAVRFCNTRCRSTALLLCARTLSVSLYYRLYSLTEFGQAGGLGRSLHRFSQGEFCDGVVGVKTTHLGTGRKSDANYVGFARMRWKHDWYHLFLVTFLSPSFL